MRHLLVVVLLLGFFFVGWFASNAVGQNTILTGNSYQQLSQGSRIMYINGFADGLAVGLVPRAEDPISNTDIGKGERIVWKAGAAERVRKCLSPMTIGQVQAITDKFLTDHPNLWHLEMGLLTISAIQTACEPRETNP